MGVKLTNTQLDKLKSARKNKTGKTSRITNNFYNKELPHGLFLTRQKTKIKSSFANSMLTDVKR